MMQLLHIPSGKFFLFYDELLYKTSGDSQLRWSIQEYLEYLNLSAEKISYSELIDQVVRVDLNESLYEELGLNPFDENFELCRAEFELMHV